ncbi:MAG: EAL domain-containing protein [Rhizobiaceae bacterium]
MALATTGYLTPIHHQLTELRMELWPRQASQQIVFVGIDKKSLDAVGVWPWPRSVHAQAIEKLSELGAAEIAFDVDFSTPSTPSEDERLAEALRNSNASVVLPTFLQPFTMDSGESGLALSTPIELFSNEAWIASVNVVPESDGLVRHYPLASEIVDELVPSLSSVLAGVEQIDLSHFPIDFSIDPQSIPTYSLADLLKGDVSRSAVEGKSILIGAHALELRDNLSTPVYGVISGPILQILAAETLVQKRVVQGTGLILILGIIVLLSILALLILPRLRLAVQMIVIIGLAVALEGGAHLAFRDLAIQASTVPILAFLALIAIVRTAGDLDVRTWLLRLAKAEAANTRQVLDQVFEDSSDAILIIRENGELLEQNAQYSMLFATSPDDPKSGSPALLPRKLSEDAQQAIQRLKANPETASSYSAQGRLELRQTGVSSVIDYSVTPSQVNKPVANSEAEIETFYIATITARDVTLEVEQRERLEYLSKFDELTGAERRNRFTGALLGNGEVESQTTIFTIGLLRFDSLVDTMGREIGDQLLCALYKKFSECNEYIAGVARLDRATFGIRLTSGTPKEVVTDFAQQLLDDLADPIMINRQAVSIDCCVGHATASIPGTATASDLLNHAEFALREAEKQGPNGIAAFNAQTNSRQRRARELEQEMRGALAAGEFHVVYQPQVESMTGKPVGAEALIRWTNPKFGKVSPVEFIEIAETTGLILQIGQFILNQACRDAMAWDEDVSVSVNVSPIQLFRGDVVQDVRNALKISGLRAERLVIELTESSFIGDDDELLHKLDLLKSMGVAIVLDDFGTGYSSLGYLARFPMDKIKVDQSFVRNLAKSPTNQAIVRSIKVLADGFDIKVLCEGVETESDLRLVQQLGCQEIQGYYFGKPQSTFEMIRFLSESDKRIEVQAPKLEVVQ